MLPTFCVTVSQNFSQIDISVIEINSVLGIGVSLSIYGEKEWKKNINYFGNKIPGNEMEMEWNWNIIFFGRKSRWNMW